jgi:hypothetical protein
MFRQPDITVGSILKECEFADYLSNFYIDSNLAYYQWLNSYTHLLQNISSLPSERFIFIHYEQLLRGDILPSLAKKLGIPIDSSFIVPALNRSKPAGSIPFDVQQLYSVLCSFSGY